MLRPKGFVLGGHVCRYFLDVCLVHRTERRLSLTMVTLRAHVFWVLWVYPERHARQARLATQLTNISFEMSRSIDRSIDRAARSQGSSMSTNLNFAKTMLDKNESMRVLHSTPSNTIAMRKMLVNQVPAATLQSMTSKKMRRRRKLYTKGERDRGAKKVVPNPPKNRQKNSFLSCRPKNSMPRPAPSLVSPFLLFLRRRLPAVDC